MILIGIISGIIIGIILVFSIRKILITIFNDEDDDYISQSSDTTSEIWRRMQIANGHNKYASNAPKYNSDKSKRICYECKKEYAPNEVESTEHLCGNCYVRLRDEAKRESEKI